MSKRTCSIEQCERRHDRNGLCATHATRKARYGDPLGGPKCLTCGSILTGRGRKKYCSDDCKPECSVTECHKPVRRNGLCNSHSSQVRITGADPRQIRQWGEREDECEVCRQIFTGSGYRSVCGDTCYRRLARMRLSGIGVSVECRRCGAQIDRLSGSRLVRNEVLTCRHCKNARPRNYSMSATELAARDGYNCSICGDEVDLTLKRPDLFCASVDHVLPRALGGSDDPSNLALAHLWCNQVKNRFTGVDLRLPA